MRFLAHTCTLTKYSGNCGKLSHFKNKKVVRPVTTEARNTLTKYSGNCGKLSHFKNKKVVRPVTTEARNTLTKYSGNCGKLSHFKNKKLSDLLLQKQGTKNYGVEDLALSTSNLTLPALVQL